MTTCTWCGRTRRSMSDWEQSGRTGWQRLCRPCAGKRLNNPYNALLPMRRCGTTTTSRKDT